MLSSKESATPKDGGIVLRGRHLPLALLLVIVLILNLLLLSSSLFSYKDGVIGLEDIGKKAETDAVTEVPDLDYYIAQAEKTTGSSDAENIEDAEAAAEEAEAEKELEAEGHADEAAAMKRQKALDKATKNRNAALKANSDIQSVKNFADKGLPVSTVKAALLWVELALALFVFLQLVQAIPWNRFLGLVVALAAAAVCAAELYLVFALGLKLQFAGWIFVGTASLAAAAGIGKAVYLFLQQPGKLAYIGDLEFLQLSKGDKKCYRIGETFAKLPRNIWNGVCNLGRKIKEGIFAIGRDLRDIGRTFVNGDWKTKTSFFVMGFGNIARGQVLRGILFFLFEAVFIFYMFFVEKVIPGAHSGWYWLVEKLPTLGTVGPHEEYNAVLDAFTTVYGDNSFKILLYGVLTVFFIIAFIYTWRQNVKQNKIAEEILATGKPLKSGKDDLHSLVDDQFHKTLLALPMTGILIFTVLPIVFMILVAFTNYDGTHDGYQNNLFGWVGLDNFRTLLTWSGKGANYSATFGEILTWTLIWAFFATFTNYFLGMLVAMAINKKGIQFKKVWRTILVLTIAIPQFISLLYVSKMFSLNGIVNGLLVDLGIITRSEAINFLGEVANNGLLPRVMVIVINIWIGIPYLMLIATGILMNIPADLYESAKIDGASGVKQFTKITLPYMLFITGPYLLTSFTGNMNNFNVIYLLTAGRPTNAAASGAAGSVGYTDLLITWLFKITQGAESQYYLASVVGILVFIVVAVISLVVYGLLPSIKNEEDFQ